MPPKAIGPSMETLQFTSVHAQVHNHFSQERNLVSREFYKQRRAAALAAWRSVITPLLPTLKRGTTQR